MLKDFLALTKPRLNFLVLLSALAGFELGRSGAFNFGALAEFAAALFMLAGGSSTLNMWMERQADAKMGRTKLRPLASGRLSAKKGLAFGLALSVVSIAWLYVRVNPLTAWLGLATWGTYLAVYTPLKRLSSISTIVGAVPGALPPVLGWTGSGHGLNAQACALFVILFLWQIPHFLAIAVMYQDEYKAAGFKVMPFEQGREATGRQMMLYALALIPASLWIFKLGLAGQLYFLVALLLGLGYIATAFYAAHENRRVAARQLLLASVFYLPLLMSAMLLDRL